MIIYQSYKTNFVKEVSTTQIEETILANYKEKTGKNVSVNEIRSWQNSMIYMMRLLNIEDIPDDSGVTIEYNIPQTSKRIDFILTGQDEYHKDHAILIELKQWEKVESTEKDGIVITQFQHGKSETPHPSYQVWSYAALLKGFNETVYEEDIQLHPCAYLHNCPADDVICHNFYSHYIDKAPVFLKGSSEQEKLQNFIKKFVKQGDKNRIMYRIDGGKIKPSKSLADSLSKMLQGNDEFVMIDDQKVVFESALALAKASTELNKNVLIVEGGPGTGKSVVAINMLVTLTKLGLLAQYVTKNAAPRAVYHAMLTGEMRRNQFDGLFSGSGSFTDIEHNSRDALMLMRHIG